MIKGYILLTKKTDISEKQFSEHWFTIHGPLALRLKRLRHYVQSHRLLHSVPEFPMTSTYSGVAEVWMDTLADAQNIPNDPDYLEGLYLDEPNFLIREQTRYLFTEEHIIMPPPALATGEEPYIKSMYLTKRLPGMSVEEFKEHWLNTHAPLIPETPGLVAYTQSHTVAEAYEQENPCYDGIAELWWPNVDTFLKAWNSKQHRDQQISDLEKFVDMENTIGILVTPRRLL